MLASVPAWPRVRVWGCGHTPFWLRRCEPLSPLGLWRLLLTLGDMGPGGVSGGSLYSLGRGKQT